MGEGEWSPPDWMYRGKKPENDDAYLENMTRVIFLAGLNWKMINERWPSFKRAFSGFVVDKVSKMGDEDVTKLMSDASIVRNRAKIVAAVKNAEEFQCVRREYGSFRRYLEGLDKSDNYASAIKDISRRFSRMGPPSVRIFLYSVGEDIKRAVT